MSPPRPHKRPDHFDVLMPDHEDLSQDVDLNMEDSNATHLGTARLLRRGDGRVVVRINRKDVEVQPWP